jgi:predicted transcriptional regulator
MSYDTNMPVIPFRVTAEIKNALKQIADKRDVAVQRVIRDIVESYLEEKGYLIIEKRVQL